MIFTAILSIALIVLIVNLVGYILSGPKYKGPITDHFDGKKFINPTGVKAKGLLDVMRWAFNRKRGPWVDVSEESYAPKPAARIDQGVKITFVNHSTFLIQVDGLNILTDPVWSERVSPFSFIGPKRKRKPGIRFEDLPAIDVVLLSHNHYDHLDLPTLTRIYQLHHPAIITPLGVKALIEKNNIKGTGDLDWWDEYKINDKISIQATPAQHFSSRGGFDRDATLWCGFMVKRKSGNIYFAGDTGYNDRTFKEIGLRCAGIDAALIPIGAYKPQWFMSPVHCSPEEAVQIHLDVRAKQSIAMHFGTFPLADEGEHEPASDLAHALTKYHLPSESFLTLRAGATRVFN